MSTWSKIEKSNDNYRVIMVLVKNLTNYFLTRIFLKLTGRTVMNEFQTLTVRQNIFLTL